MSKEMYLWLVSVTKFKNRPFSYIVLATTHEEATKIAVDQVSKSSSEAVYSIETKRLASKYWWIRGE